MPFKNKEDERIWQKKHDQLPKVRFRHYKKDAKKRGLIFELTYNEFLKLINGVCYYCGGNGYGIDRLDSSFGYLKDNVVPCCSVCNRMKYTYTEDEFIEKCIKIVNFKLHKKIGR